MIIDLPHHERMQFVDKYVAKKVKINYQNMLKIIMFSKEKRQYCGGAVFIT
jgi:hypothetical protein